jgi:hypothetical protein
MSRLKHPSPALVVSVLALVAAVVVPAVAQVATTALTKREKRVVKKIARTQANKQITRRATEFTPAGEVHSPARLVLNDPTPGDTAYANSNLLTAGPFRIFVRCAENHAGGSNERAQVFVFGPSGSSFAGGVTDGFDFNEPSSDNLGISEAQSSANAVQGGHVTVVAPNGQVFRAQASAEVGDSAGDCVFGATAIGP